ncbi:hypothetical protein UB31_21080 [Bradyrhizobium sp. LTSP849]|uniref:hypothetical protein n=1 Tax=Bradyrhizobium sp. LTSP849 TaxID=1615890 RepID=UPI0005E02A8A|nr:hypothetical protein [Bradyrhizobium sp. LTSP849]KJC45183.1 hypothetical protein UB31_21080 [Bradyrhizobium sp. LTSP849]
MRTFLLGILVTAALTASPLAAVAQGTQQQGQKSQAQTPRRPVATQPSNSPFQNPIGQGVPPAVSANPNLNSNSTLTNPPR